MATVRNYFRDTTTEPGTSAGATPPTYDLSTTQGTTGATITATTNSTSAVETLRWQREVGADLTGTSFPYSVVISQVGSVSMRWRVQRVNSSGTVQASSAYSTVYTTTGTFTGTLTLSTTWATGDWLRLSFEHFVTGGHGNQTIGVDVQNASTYIDADITQTFQGEGALDGSGDIAGTGITLVSGASALDGSGDVAAAGVAVGIGEGALDGSGDLIGDGNAITVGAGDLAGEGSLVGSGFTLALAAGALDGSGDVAGDAFTVAFAAGSVAGEGVFAGEGVAVALGTADLDGSGDLAGTGLTDADFQYARPVSDVVSGGWVVTPLWSKVNEETENDSPLITSTDTTLCELALGTVQVPDAGDVTIYVRASKTTGAPADLRVRLVEGTTVRAERLLDALTTSKVTYPLVLTALERDAITNWGNLRIRLARE